LGVSLDVESNVIHLLAARGRRNVGEYGRPSALEMQQTVLRTYSGCRRCGQPDVVLGSPTGAPLIALLPRLKAVLVSQTKPVTAVFQIGVKF